MKYSIIFITILLFSTLAYAEEIEFKTGSDNLEIGEALGDVIPAFDSAHLSMLADNTLKTTKGDKKYKQYLRFHDANLAIASATPVYDENDDDLVSDFLKIPDGSAVTDAIFEYELDFDEGADSDIDPSTNTLEDFRNAKIKFMNKEYVIVTTDINTASNRLTIELLSGATVTTMYESDEKNFTVDGTSFQVKMNTITSSPRSVSISINGKTSNLVKQGETIAVGDVVLGITKILVSSGNETADRADIYIGKDHIALRDADYTDDSFHQGVDIGGKAITKGYVKIKGTEVTSTEFELDSITYRLLPYSKKGTDIYIAPNQKLTTSLKNEYAMLGSWDLDYKGLSAPSATSIIFDPSADSAYDLIFTNVNDKKFTFPFVSNTADFKLGEQTSQLFFIEPSSTTDFLIGKDDYILLTSANSKTGKSSVLRLNSVSTATKELTFDDLSSGQVTATYTDTSVSGALGEGELSVEGVNYKFYVANTSENNISIDLTNDGSINSGEAKLIVKGGGILDLGSTNTPTDDFTVSLTTDGTQFEESSTDETISFTMEKNANNKVGISSLTGVTTSKESGNEVGLTNYGVRVTLTDEGGDSAEDLSIDYPASQVFANVFLISTSEQKANVTIIDVPTCTDGIKNQDEASIDCGGSICDPCQVLEGTCEDGIKNQDEEDIDCGGTICEACIPESQCQGCLINEQCYEIGTKIDNTTYCSETFTVANLKANKELCLQNYECLSGICEENSCKAAKREGISTTMIILINLVVLIVILVAVISILKLNKEPPQAPPAQPPQTPPKSPEA